MFARTRENSSSTAKTRFSVTMTFQLPSESFSSMSDTFCIRPSPLERPPTLCRFQNSSSTHSIAISTGARRGSLASCISTTDHGRVDSGGLLITPEDIGTGADVTATAGSR